MNIVDISIKRPILVGMGLIALVVFGFLAYFGMPQSLLSDVAVPYITIQTVYPGASPQVIENQITKKVEDTVSSVSGLDTITSYSLDNASFVLAQFSYGIDENIALLDVKAKIEAITSDLPAEARKPVISKMDLASQSPVMSIILESDMSPADLNVFATSVLSDTISQVAGVGSVSVSGGVAREIQVNLDRTTVYERAIPIIQVSGILAAANAAMPGGNLAYDGADIPVQLKGEFTSLEEIMNLDVPTQTGIFKLHQLASIDDATTTVRERTILLDKKAGTRNENAMLVGVIKNPSANTVELVRDVQKLIPVIEKQSGGRVHLKVIKEDATYVRDTVNDTLSNVYLGIIFTGLVLLLFLHDIRSTLIVALAMPFSIVATFLVMKATGLSLNMISLLGLSSSTGTLVANSVVVIENIFRHKSLGHDKVTSASVGTKEVVGAVFASTLTNVVVFVPLIMISSLMGSVLREFSLTVVIATVFSIVISFTLTPMMAARVLPEKIAKPGRIGALIENAFEGWKKAYSSALSWMLASRRRCAAIVAGTVLAFVVCMSLFGMVRFELMPLTDGGKIQIAVELPQGSDLAATAVVLESVEKLIASYDEVETVQTTLGSLGSLDTDVSVALVNVFLTPRGERSRSNKILASRMTETLSDVPGAEFRVTPLSEITMAGTAAIDLFIRGTENEQLLAMADEVKSVMEKVPGVTNVALSSRSGKLELVLSPIRKQISQDGATVLAVALALRTAVDGYVATTYKEDGQEYDVRVKVSGTDLKDIEDIRNIPVVTAAGTYPLSRYADVSFENGTNKIMRTDKTRTIEVTCDLLPGYSGGNVQGEVLSAIEEQIEMPAGYSVGLASVSEMMNETISDLLFAFIIAILLTYMVLAASLESLTQPLFILATIPLSLIGVVVSALMTVSTLNFIALVGIIMLVGIVVNNAILMLDYYNQLTRSGMKLKEAMQTAFPEKLKAILMSNIAIILGMVPMALGIGASGSEMRQPMGVIIIGGVVSSTLLTLFVIPALEYIMARTKHVGRQKRHAARMESGKEILV